MSINVSQTSMNSQEKSFAGVSRTNYINYSSRRKPKSIDLSRLYDAASIGNELKDSQSTFWQKYSDIPQNNEKVKRVELIAALIKPRSLPEYKLAQNKWELYVAALYNEVEAGNVGFTTKVLDNARQVLKNLNSHFRQNHLFLEVPDACPGESDDFMFLWSKGEHHLECEIFGDGAVEFFYRNRATDEVWGEDITLESKLTPAIMKKLMLFVKTER